MQARKKAALSKQRGSSVKSLLGHAALVLLTHAVLRCAALLHVVVHAGAAIAHAAGAGHAVLLHRIRAVNGSTRARRARLIDACASGARLWGAWIGA